MERYIRNPYGITIRCCCATCQHKTLDRTDDSRRCQKLMKPNLPTCPGYDPLGAQSDRPQGYTIQHAGNGYGRIQSPAYIAWKRLHYEEILQRHQPPETFSRFWSRVHELFERQTGLSVYMNF